MITLKRRTMLALSIVAGIGMGPWASANAPLTLDSLNDLRAEQDHTKESLDAILNPDDGSITMVPLIGNTFSDAVGLIREAYKIPICIEYDCPPGEVPPSKPYRIEDNQSLLSALDELSALWVDGLVEWRLMEGRIVLTARTEHDLGTPATLDRIVKVDIEAFTLEEALSALEIAFNEQHRDNMPLILSLACINVDILAGEESRKPYLLTGAMSMREALLIIIQQTENQSSCYSYAQEGSNLVRTIHHIYIQARPCHQDPMFDHVIYLEDLIDRRDRYWRAIDEAQAVMQE